MGYRNFNSLVDIFFSKPLPSFLTSIYLSLRWKCWVSLKTNIYYPFNIKIGKGAIIRRDSTIIARGKGVFLGKKVEICQGAALDTQGGKIIVDDYTAIGPYTLIYGGGGVVLGKECSIAGHSIIVSTKHVFKDTFVPIRRQGNLANPITIKDDVWIGANCVILDGVIIGKGSIVGAGSVVNQDIDELTIVAGSPARCIKARI